MKKIMIMMLLMGITAAAVKAGQLELKAPQGEKVSPRKLVTLGFTVTNNGSGEVKLKFSVQIPQFWELLRTPDPRTVAPGEEIIVPVTVLIPAHASQGRYQIQLVAEEGSSRLVASSQLEVTSLSGAKLSFSQRQLVIPKGSKVTLGMWLENTGNSPDNFWLRTRTVGELKATPLGFKESLGQGEIWEGMLMVEAPLMAELGAGWLEIEVGQKGDVRVLARERLAVTVVSAATSPYLNPELLGKLSLELLATGQSPLQLQGSFQGGSKIGRGYLSISLEKFYQEPARSFASWRQGKWALAAGDIYLSVNSLQEPLEKRGLLFTLQEAGKNTNFFWYPGNFTYRKGPSSLALATDKEQKLWFFGRTEAGGKVKIWGEVGLPVAGPLISSSTSIRLGGQRKAPGSFLLVDWLEAGTNTWGRNQDLWRLSLTGQNNPLLFSFYSQHDLLRSALKEERGSLGVNLPLTAGNIMLRLGQGRRTSIDSIEEAVGWEAILNQRWGNVYLYLSQSAMPFGPRRVQLRLGRATNSFSSWLAASRQEGLQEVQLGLLWRRGSRQWEFLWQGQEKNQWLALNLNQALAGMQTLRVGSKVSYGAATNWEFTLGYGVGLKLPIPLLKTKSSLAGRIFIDENGNGSWDHQEQVLAGVGVYLGGELTTSDHKGLYAFGSQEPGEYTLLLATETLPMGILALTKSSLIHLHRGEEATWDWPLVRGSIVRGKLLLQEGQSKIAAQGVLIAIVENERTVARALTDPAGNFQTPFLPPGSYLLYPQLPDYEPGTITVELGPGQEKELELVLNRKNKPQEQIFRAPEVQIMAVK